MCEIKDDKALYVTQINKRFEELKHVSNDELRTFVERIKDNIAISTNLNTALDDALIDVYAIVKETARRFSLGKIVVTANSHDKILAEKYDFVSIEDSNAVYNNHWIVEGEPYNWNMVHYDEQLLAGIYLHLGRAIEMATGEGKTIVATLPVFLNALTHHGVHVMTVNDYLSKRDCQITRPLYMLYGLNVDCIEFYKRHDYRRKLAYEADITFGANSSFVFDYLFDHLAIDPKECLQRTQNYAIIDEVDSILIDEAETPHIVSGGMPYNDGEIYRQYLPIIKELVIAEDEAFYTADKLNHIATFTIKGKKWLSKKLNNDRLYQVHKSYEVDDFESLSIKKKNQILQNIRLQNVLEQLLNALVVYEKDVDYLIINNQVKIIDQNTGRIKYNSRWRHGLHTAVEVKENVKVQSDSGGMAVITLKNYFKLYNKIAGMSGTIQPIKDELAEVYGLETSIIPSHLPIIRKDLPLRIYKSKESKDREILSNVLSNRLKGRPTLIGTLSLKRADEIEKLFSDLGLKFNRLDARTTRDEAETVAKAGFGNTITLSTSVAGRGTDIKPSDDAIHNGGLSVIGADLFGSIRTDLQLRGRSGRQGNPGSSIFYASLEDDIIGYLSDDERAELSSIASNIEGDDISIGRIIDYFVLAQSKREEILRNRRIETSRKDDTIAPYRAKFYEQRNRALFDAHYPCEQVYKILADLDKSYIDKSECKISDLYTSTKEIVRRSKRNNPSRKNIFIPYSVNQSPFVIKLDVDLILTSEEYFKKEYKRQNLLQVYDRFWKDFVLYVMENLDPVEINALPQKYMEMINAINSVLCGRMLGAAPTFKVELSEESKVEEYIPVPETTKTKNKPHHLKPTEICPCGSGKRYIDCHGVQRIIRRRR